MHTVKNKNGKHCVMHGEKIITACDTNAEAWRECDKLNGELNNKQEATSKWIYDKQE